MVIVKNQTQPERCSIQKTILKFKQKRFERTNKFKKVRLE